jgi:hypothetical protein
MALVVSTLETSIKAINAAMSSGNGLTADQYAHQLAQAIDAYIKTATVTIPLGVPVSTAGTAAAQTGATTAPAVGSLS